MLLIFRVELMKLDKQKIINQKLAILVVCMNLMEVSISFCSEYDPSTKYTRTSYKGTVKVENLNLIPVDSAVILDRFRPPNHS